MSSSLGASSSQGTNEGANQSTVYASATVTITAGYFQGRQSYGYISIGDATYTIVGPTYMAALSDPHVAPESWSFSAQRTYDHDANGYRGDVGVSASFAVDSASFHNSSAGAATQGAINYDRKPAAPTSVTAVLNADRTITVTSNAVSSPAGTATYYIQSSSNGGSSWSSEITISGNNRYYTYAVNALAPGGTYLFRMRASNSDGTSAYTNSGSLFYPSSGKRTDGTSWSQMVTAKRFDGSSFIDITTAKRYDGSDWVNLG